MCGLWNFRCWDCVRERWKRRTHSCTACCSYNSVLTIAAFVCVRYTFLTILALIIMYWNTIQHLYVVQYVLYAYFSSICTHSCGIASIFFLKRTSRINNVLEEYYICVEHGNPSRLAVGFPLYTKIKYCLKHTAYVHFPRTLMNSYTEWWMRLMINVQCFRAREIFLQWFYYCWCVIYLNSFKIKLKCLLWECWYIELWKVFDKNISLVRPFKMPALVDLFAFGIFLWWFDSNRW